MVEKADRKLSGGPSKDAFPLHSKDCDETSLKLLRELLRDPRRSMRQLSAVVAISPPAVADRVRRLEDIGVIKGYKAVIDHERLGWPVSAFLSMSARDGRCDLLLDALRALPNVIAAYHIAGATDYIARVVSSDLKELNSITELLSLVGKVSSQVVLGTAFERDPL